MIQQLSIFSVMRAFQRLIAAASICVVIALAVFAASPEAHDWLCHHSKAPSAHSDEADSCVVTAFGSGQLLALATLALALLFVVVPSGVIVTREASDYPESDGLLPASCGPPASA